MTSTPARSLAEEERTKILEKVVAEYRRLCESGFPRTARSRAIELKVPAKLRRQRNGDRDRWWGWLDKALRASSQSPPTVPKPLTSPAPLPIRRYFPTKPEGGYWWDNM
jgi:hypothetical protein